MAVHFARYNEYVNFGFGARETIVPYIKTRGYKKALVITDKDLIKFGVTAKVTDILDANKIEYAVFADVDPNPAFEEVFNALDKYHAENCDFVIGVGGGSPLDVGKLVGTIVANSDLEDGFSYEHFYACAPFKNKAKFIAITTTAGTGSEGSAAAAIKDNVLHVKRSFNDPSMVPPFAIVDPELMMSVPPKVRAACGMDALTHAIESYISTVAFPVSQMAAIGAMELIGKYLVKSVKDPSDREAVEAMSMAQYMAVMSFAQGRLGLVHYMAHMLSAYYNTAHGVANAMLLATVLEFNAQSPTARARYPKIAQALGVDTRDMTEDEGVEACLKAIRDMADELGIPKTMNEIGAKIEDADDLARLALEDKLLPTNPVQPTQEQVKELYLKLFV